MYTGWVNDVTNGLKAGITAMDWIGLVVVSFLVPAIVSWLVSLLLRKIKWIKEGDLKLEVQ